VFIDSTRPDVQVAFPTYPRNYMGGWGFMVLTKCGRPRGTERTSSTRTHEMEKATSRL
jgi:hypothetical protein